MSDKELNTRREHILSLLQLGKEYALSELGGFFSEVDRPSPATLRRDMSQLRDIGYVQHSGDRKSSRYAINTRGMLNAPIDPRAYCDQDVDQRSAATRYNFGLFQDIDNEIFSKTDIETMDQATQAFIKKSQDASDVIQKKELERFVIELSWKSSKIEGNTYTLLDTERLLKDGVQAAGHTKEEAIMIINHKKAFQYIREHKKSYKELSIRAIEDIHRILIEGLNVPHGVRNRQVGITGSSYRPLAVPSQIKEALGDMCSVIKEMKNPYTKALIALVGTSYIQPFEDGNKRTSRLLANAILIACGGAPLSYRSADATLYKKSMLVFYEKNSIVPIREMFMRQYIFACEQYLQF
jgi:fido (protein-threonine AMPylation protein)